LAIYNSEQDLFITDKDNNSFRQKVSFKYTIRINPVKTRKKGKKNIDKSISIERLSLPIPAKSPKKISKYFKMVGPAQANASNGKLYAQASKSRSSTKEILKIKEAFLNLKANKIENIQKIIKSNSKSKPRINITTKDSSGSKSLFQ